MGLPVEMIAYDFIPLKVFITNYAIVVLLILVIILLESCHRNKCRKVYKIIVMLTILQETTWLYKLSVWTE